MTQSSLNLKVNKEVIIIILIANTLNLQMKLDENLWVMIKMVKFINCVHNQVGIGKRKVNKVVRISTVNYNMYWEIINKN